MKGFIILSIIMCYFNYTFSQEIFKAEGGKYSTELNINPLKGELSLNNSINQIKFRYFKTANKCYRFGIIINQENTKETNEYIYNQTTPQDIETKESKTRIALSFGIERHFNGTNRLSPYIGFEGMISDSWFKTEVDNNGTKSTIKNTTLETIYEYRAIPTSTGYSTLLVPVTVGEERAGISIGCALITGFDFYFSKNLFLGYEFNISASFTDFKKVEEENINNGSSYSYTDLGDENDAKEFFFGPKLINGVRLGFVF